MTQIKYLLVLFMLAVVFQSPQQPAETKKCERLTRAKTEELWGQPTKCSKEMKGITCFGGQWSPIMVQFNESGVVEQVRMHNPCTGLHWLRKELDRILPENLRGELQKKMDVSPKGSCEWINEEDYECVKIKFTQELCMGCSPASITIDWK